MLNPKYNLGYIILISYLVSTYVGGWLLSKIFDFEKRYSNFYSYDVTPIYFVVIIIFILLLANFFFKTKNRRNEIVDWVRLKNKIYAPNWSTFVFLVYLIFAIIFAFQYGFSFRHSGIGIFNSSYYVGFLFVCKFYLYSFVFSEFLIFCNDRLDYKTPKFRLILISAGLIFFLVGALDVLYIMATLFLLLKNKVKEKVFIQNQSISFVSRMQIKYLFIIILSLFLVFYIGLSNKYNKPQSLNSTLLNIEKYEMIASEYLGNSFAVLIILNSRILRNNELKTKIFYSPINLFKHRIKFLLGQEKYIDKPLNSSVADYTYLYTRNNVSEESRTGASPGLIGTLIIIPFFSLGMFFFIIGIIYFVSLLNSIPTNFTILGYLFAYLFVYVLFKNPLDYLLNPTHPMALYFVLIIIIIKSMIFTNEIK